MAFNDNNPLEEKMIFITGMLSLVALIVWSIVVWKFSVIPGVERFYPPNKVISQKQMQMKLEPDLPQQTSQRKP